ncbi:MAG: class I SAM-dependent methyltransferase [Bacteroidetes bacterium]|jgi:ubiquinone/menaquinone biosynthesis C-methylase UbiE|nr:class I SAM-dependent methyltransferase [Bacteroidota bacterium]
MFTTTKINKMIKTNVFEKNVLEYDSWFKKYPAVFISEVEALRDMLPEGNSFGIEVGLGTGRFSEALGIKEGIEPAAGMRALAIDRGIEAMEGIAERLPYKDLRFDFVLMVSSVSYFFNIIQAFREANRVLKPGGRLVIGFIEKDSAIGKFYEEKRADSLFYHQAIFYSTGKLVERLQETGFGNFDFAQTLFHSLDEIKNFEPSKPGYGKGSFVVIKAIKK